MFKSSKKGFLFMNIHVLKCEFIWTTFFNQTLKFLEAMVRCLFWNFAIDPQKSYNDSCYELIIIEAQGPHYSILRSFDSAQLVILTKKSAKDIGQHFRHRKPEFCTLYQFGRFFIKAHFMLNVGF